MSLKTLSVDTPVSPVHVLSFYDDIIYQMVEKIAGLAEAKLLEIQGIRGVYSFLNTGDVFGILSILCSALKDIKKWVCLEANDETYLVKPGCRSSIQYLYQLLQQRHEEHLKAITQKSKRNKQALSQQSSATNMNLSQPRSISSGRKRPYTNHLQRKTAAVYSDRLRQSYTMLYGVLRSS